MPSKKISEIDIGFMKEALALAREGLGKTSPNPTVGCVIVKHDQVISFARTANHGRPHAEALAIEKAGNAAEGATAYVTLMPCNTHGKMPPCAKALIDAGIARLVVACSDPSQNSDETVARLKGAGIDVQTGVCEDEALSLNEGYFKWVKTGKPLVSLKIATTLDGKIASLAGHSKWLTGEEARKDAHYLRSQNDAVLVGRKTAELDKPQLNVRHIKTDFQPKAVVIDRDNRLNLADNVLKISLEEGLPINHEGFFEPSDMLNHLGKQDVRRLLVEGGGKTLSYFFKRGEWDYLYWYKAPMIAGNDGLPAFHDGGIETVEKMPRLVWVRSENFGRDVLDVWKRV